MNPGSRSRRGMVRGFFLMLLIAFFVSCDMIYLFSSSPAPTSTQAPGSSPETLTARNVSRLREAWSDTIGGTARFTTAPTIADGIIYIGSENKLTDGSSTGALYALDATSGHERWSYSTRGMVSSTPVAAYGAIYFVSVNYDNGTNMLAALDAKTGTRLWSYDAGRYSSFPTAEPLANGVIYISPENGVLEALDARVGTKLWSYGLGVKRELSTAPTVANGVVYIGTRDVNRGSYDMLEAVDARVGTRPWSYSPGVNRGLSTSPTVANGVVYIGSGDVNPSSGDKENGVLEALDAKTGTRLWSYSSGVTKEFSTAPTVANGVVYIDSWDLNRGDILGKIMLYALSATSGMKVWSYDMGSGFTTETSDLSLAITNGVVYFDSMPYGKLFALDAKSGTKLWNYFIAGPLTSLPAATNNMIYTNSLKTLYAFGLAIQAAIPTATPSSANDTTQHLVPSINKAPVFATIPGLHIQSTEGLQCPSSNLITSPAEDLIFTTGRLTYSKDEIKRIRNYLHEILYGSESLANAYTITPPPTLHWVLGSDVCTLKLEISNTGNTTVQISSLGVQFKSTPQPNSSQQLHSLDFCSIANQQDAATFCAGHSGGGACGKYAVHIALKAAPASSVFAKTPDRGYGNSERECPEPILHPNDTFDFAIQLTSPGKKPDTVAPYLYAVAPILTVIGANGSRTFTLSSMTSIAAFVDRHQITCYGLQNDQDTTLVPKNTRQDYSVCSA